MVRKWCDIVENRILSNPDEVVDDVHDVVIGLGPQCLTMYIHVEDAICRISWCRRLELFVV